MGEVTSLENVETELKNSVKDAGKQYAKAVSYDTRLGQEVTASQKHYEKTSTLNGELEIAVNNADDQRATVETSKENVDAALAEAGDLLSNVVGPAEVAKQGEVEAAAGRV